MLLLAELLTDMVAFMLIIDDDADMVAFMLIIDDEAGAELMIIDELLLIVAFWSRAPLPAYPYVYVCDGYVW